VQELSVFLLYVCVCVCVCVYVCMCVYIRSSGAEALSIPPVQEFSKASALVHLQQKVIIESPLEDRESRERVL
jgi:hypothetical protein